MDASVGVSVGCIIGVPAWTSRAATPVTLPMEQAVIARRLDLQTPRGDSPAHLQAAPRVGEDSVAAAAPQASVDRYERLYGDAFASLEADRQRHVIASADLTRRLSGSPKHR